MVKHRPTPSSNVSSPIPGTSPNSSASPERQDPVQAAIGTNAESTATARTRVKNYNKVSLLEAANYALNNLESAKKENLIIEAPDSLRADLDESVKLLRSAIEQGQVEPLFQAAKHTLANLDRAAEKKLILTPRWFQVQLGESAKNLRAAIEKAEGPKTVVKLSDKLNSLLGQSHPGLDAEARILEERTAWLEGEVDRLSRKVCDMENAKNAAPEKGMELTITITGHRSGDLEDALGEVTRQVGEGYLSGANSNDTGDYSFDIKGEEYTPQKKLVFNVKLSKKTKDQDHERLLDNLQEKLDDHQVQSHFELDGRKFTITCEGPIDDHLQDRIDRSVVEALDNAELSYTYDFELTDPDEE